MASNDVDQALAIGGEEAAKRLIKIPEDQWFDRKSGRIEPRALAKPLVAFANAEGGTIAVGISDGKVEGVTAEKCSAIRQAAMDYTVPAVRTSVSEIKTKRGNLVIIQVSPGQTVHETASGECYLRIGDESRKLRFSERSELEYDRGSIPFDGTPSPVGQLSDSKVEELRKLLGSTTKRLALRARNLLTPQGKPNVAAYLLLSDHPQDVYPNAYVRVLRYVGETRGEGFNQMLESGADYTFEGSLPEQIEKSAKKISELMPSRRALGDNGKFTDVCMIPRAAWMEGLVNAVTHRSYSMAGDCIRVEIFSNRLEITSPGKFPGVVNLDNPLSIYRHARNPRIARVLADMQITQELGEGIRRIVQEMRRIGLVDPVYDQTGNSVTLTLLASDSLPQEIRSSLPKSSQKILRALRTAGKALGTGELIELTGLARPTVLRHLKILTEANVVHWQGNSANDPRASWSLR